MAANVVIRIAEVSDLDGINEVDREIREEPGTLHKPPVLLLGDIEQRDNQVVFVAIRDTVIVGYLRLYSSESFQRAGDVDLVVFVRPPYREEGIGKELLRMAENYAVTCTKLSRLTLGVKKENRRARKLYAGVGFNSVSKDSFGEKMVKDIKR